MSDATTNEGETSRSKNVGTTERVLSALAGGGMLALGLWRISRNPWRLALALAGAPLLARAASGRCALYRALGIDTRERGDTRGVTPQRSKIVESTVTINAPAATVYDFWHRFENLPKFMNHLVSVERLEGGGWHWVAKAPLGKTVEWDAEVTQDIAERLIAWRSRPGSQIANEGTVEFAAAPGGRGTEVKVRLMYEPPAGSLGVAVAKLFGEEPQQQVNDDLHRLKALLETGEIPTTDGQPTGKPAKKAEAAANQAPEGDKTDAPAVETRGTQDGSVAAETAPTTPRATQDGKASGQQAPVASTLSSGTFAPPSAGGRASVGFAPPPVITPPVVAPPVSPAGTAAIPTTDPATEMKRKETADERKAGLRNREDFESDQSFPASDPPSRY